MVYLGCSLNRQGKTEKEVKQRIANCMATLNKLQRFWKHSNCPLRFKIIVQDAVIRTKLLYGLESAELTDGALNKLDVFQLKGLRKILNMATTYIDRANTNEKVFEQIHKAANPNNRHLRQTYKTIRKFSTIYMKRKLLLAQQILNLPDQDPMKEATLETSTLKQIDLGKKCTGRPTTQWVDTAMKQVWDRSKHTFLSPYNAQQFDPDKPPHRKLIKEAAQRRTIM